MNPSLGGVSPWNPVDFLQNIGNGTIDGINESMNISKGNDTVSLKTCKISTGTIDDD